ncbi:DNA replication/repair protein RecF [Lagierella sp.]|uniref:DNA replication/repair protein RecF n=1 Tax=Lagierella sp. TaxID=2849657 RepID=UPI0026127518|nr:DNA replication/repair protein RecF [Lagierella sp.]
MKINNCYLLNFRNFNNLNIRFFDKINVITGGNAQGKTNILEGVYFSAKGKSFKSVKESDLIKIDKRESFIRTDVESDGLEEKIELKLSKDSSKVIRINENKVDTMQELRTFFDIVTFIPEDIKIIKESKSYRRDFIDEVIIGLLPGYNSLLIKYNNILNQRNYILKYKKQGRYFKEQIRASTKQLAQEGAKIMRMRSKYIGIIEEYAIEIHKRLTSEKEIISLDYNGKSKDYDYDIIKNSQVLYSQLEENLDRDLNLGFTSVGPHRDDISIFVNDMDSRIFLSQGQQRTLTLSLKLSQIKLYDDFKEVSPVILLDDVFSELDRERTNYLLNSIKDYQSIITSTDESFLQDYTDEYRVFELMDNELKVKKFR